MPKTMLTDALCDTARPPTAAKRKYVIYYDAAVAGFGLRVTQAGAKSFILNYYAAGGTERRLTIGTFRDPWKTSAARKEALRLKKLIDQGEDPQGEKNELRAAPTVRDLIERWRVEHAAKNNRPSTTYDNEYLIKQWLMPAFSTRRVAELRYSDIESWHRKIGTSGGRGGEGTPYRANRALALLSKMLSLAIRWEWRADNPCRSVERFHEEARRRYLKPDEIMRLAEVLTVYENRAAADAIRLLMLTGARTSEVVKATWDQFDLTEGVWRKPSAATKSRREHEVPLSAPARQLLAAVRGPCVNSVNSADSSRLFPGLARVRGSWQRICRRAGIEGARVHDLRHTYASVLVNSGKSLAIIGALLGHTTPTTTARYSHLFADPLRAATERAGAILFGSKDGGGEVVDLPPRGLARR